jgi:hypothetical protein
MWSDRAQEHLEARQRRGGDDPGQGRKAPSVTAESSPGKEMSTARPSSRKFEHIGIVAVVGAFASVGLVCFVLAIPHPVEPSLGDRTAQPSGVRANSTSATAAEDAIRSKSVTPPLTETVPTLAMPMLYQLPTSLSDAQLAASSHEVGIWHDRPAEAAPRLDRKPSPSQRASRRHWPRYSVRAQADRGEAARLMSDELRQRGVDPVSSVRGARRDRRPWREMRRGESPD